MIIDCHNHIGAEMLFYFQGYYPYCQDLPTLVENGRAVGVDRWIVFPMVSNAYFKLDGLYRGKLEEGGMDEAPYVFENRRMLSEINELFPAYGKKTLPFVMFDPGRETGKQAAALRKLRGDYPFFGLKVQPTILESPITGLREGGRVFLELAEEWDIPMLIHSSINPNDIWAQAKDIIDIAEENPRVRFCVAHSCRFHRPSLDRIAALPNTWFDCSAHCIHCDLAVTDNPTVATPETRFESDYRDPARVLHDLAQAFPEKLMWGSDSPYYSWVTNQPGMALHSSYPREADALMRLPEDLRERVGYTNTRDCLKLKDESPIL